ncbi:MAG: cytochrome b/b6 domain-containing protein [Burkholderiaceae bacterium]|nr:cytochrome b/b6 domain-containing protein [Burkholderiaceae bacterium]
MNANSSIETSINVCATAPGRRVTDAATRMFHWLFALSFLGAYITADGERWREIHMMLGYLMIGLLAARIIWGLAGPKRVRLTSLAARIRSIKPWSEKLRAGQSIWQTSWITPQNVLMATLIALLLLTAIPLVLTGYLTNADVAGELMEELHEFFGEFYLLLVLAHLAAIGILSLVRQRNLANPMLTGRLNEKGPDLVKNNYAWLALLLTVGSLAWCIYYLSL